MAGVWDALGAGIERGVAAYLQGQETQAQRKREEEEKARELERWLYGKMQSERAAGLSERQFELEQQQAEAARTRAAEELVWRKSEGEAERASAEKIAGMREGGKQKEQAPEKLLYTPGFNNAAAFQLFSDYMGGQSSAAQLKAALGGPQGQQLAEGAVNFLSQTFGYLWPQRDLSTDFWRYFKGIAPNLKVPGIQAPPPAAPAREPTPGVVRQPQPLPKTMAELQAAIAQPPAMFQGGTVSPELVTQPPQAVVSPELQLGTETPRSLREMVMGRSSQQVTPGVTTAQGPTPEEQRTLDTYKQADRTLKMMMEKDPAARAVLNKYLWPLAANVTW